MYRTQESDSFYQDVSSKAEVSLIGKPKSTRMKDWATECQENGSQQELAFLGRQVRLRGRVASRMQPVEYLGKRKAAEHGCEGQGLCQIRSLLGMVPSSQKAKV